MSRYVHLELPLRLDEAVEALAQLELTPTRGLHGGRIMLDGSLECAGEPVDLRLAAGVCGSVEDFGLVFNDGRCSLVCGDVDQRRLEREFLNPLLTKVSEARIRAGLAPGETIETSVEADGTRRIVIRRD